MKTILWKSKEYASLELCSLDAAEPRKVRSRIIGVADNQPFFVEYVLDLDAECCVRRFYVECEISQVKQFFFGEQLRGSWTINGSTAPEYNGFRFIDISLTPLTNTMPIRHLNLDTGAAQEIEVVYLDLLENRIRPARQNYMHVGMQIYKFETIPKDFEATIIVDRFGFVETYQDLFEKTNEFSH